MIAFLALLTLVAVASIGVTISREWASQKADYLAEISEDEYR